VLLPVVLPQTVEELLLLSLVHLNNRRRLTIDRIGLLFNRPTNFYENGNNDKKEKMNNKIT